MSYPLLSGSRSGSGSRRAGNCLVWSGDAVVAGSQSDVERAVGDWFIVGWKGRECWGIILRLVDGGYFGQYIKHL